ncbi:hypothetical protein Tco_1155545 [Tanacetum coccineum]
MKAKRRRRERKVEDDKITRDERLGEEEKSREEKRREERIEKKQLKQAQCKVEAIPSNKQLKEELDKILGDYEEALFGEEKLLAQKEKIEWLSEGDRNNKYFHHVLKSRKNASKTMGICDENGKWFNEDKVVEAMFDIGNEKAHGPDDFIALFFKKIWDIMGKDVCLAIKEFFMSGKLLGENHKSVNVINEVLKEFSLASGLKPNMNKSTIFFGSVNPIEKKRIMEIISLLVEKVKGKVNDWKNKSLSYVGRLQLIASVLASMHVY